MPKEGVKVSSPIRLTFPVGGRDGDRRRIPSVVEPSRSSVPSHPTTLYIIVVQYESFEQQPLLSVVNLEILLVYARCHDLSNRGYLLV